MTFVRGTAQELINWQKTEGYGFPVAAITLIQKGIILQTHI